MLAPAATRMAMRPARTATQAIRVQKPIRIPRARFQSTSSSSSSSSSTFSTEALTGGLVGGSAVFLLGYVWYQFSGLPYIAQTASQTKKYYDSVTKKIQEKAPEPNEALQWLRETVTSYTRVIPGASQYVDTAFNDIDKVREKHSGEVDQIVRETYNDLKDVTKKGVSFDTVTQAWEILQHAMTRIASLSGSAAQDILDNHPYVKSQVGPQVQQLQQMRDQYGPEAQQMIDETWKQVQDILKGGLTFQTVARIQQLVQEKTEQVKKYGDQAWQKGLEQVKPMLDKNPQLKELVENNKSSLLQGDLSQLWEKVKSGNVDDLKSFVEQQGQKFQGGGGGGSGMLEQALGMIPGGKELGPKLQQLQELSQKHGKEAEDLVKSAIEDVKKVLSQKVEEGQKLKDKAVKDAKK